MENGKLGVIRRQDTASASATNMVDSVERRVNDKLRRERREKLKQKVVNYLALLFLVGLGVAGWKAWQMWKSGELNEAKLREAAKGWLDDGTDQASSEASSEVSPVAAPMTAQLKSAITVAQTKVQGDIRLASARMTEISRDSLASGRGKVAEVGTILSDETLNQLALTYIGTDWALPHSTFLGSVQHIRELMKMQQKARKDYQRKVAKQIENLENRKRRAMSGMNQMNRPVAHSSYDVVVKRRAQLNSSWRGGVSGAYGEVWRVNTRRQGELDSTSIRQLGDIDRELAILNSTDWSKEELNEVVARQRHEEEIFNLASQYQADSIGVLMEVMKEWRDMLGRQISERDAAQLTAYFQAMETFGADQVARWRDAPESLKPKSAASGTEYHALVLTGEGSFDLYRVKALGGGNLEVQLLSPIVAPVAVPADAFRAACKGRKYFIAHSGTVYLCGKAQTSDLASLPLPRG